MDETEETATEPRRVVQRNVGSTGIIFYNEKSVNVSFIFNTAHACLLVILPFICFVQRHVYVFISNKIEYLRTSPRARNQ